MYNCLRNVNALHPSIIDTTLQQRPLRTADYQGREHGTVYQTESNMRQWKIRRGKQQKQGNTQTREQDKRNNARNTLQGRNKQLGKKQQTNHETYD